MTEGRLAGSEGLFCAEGTKSRFALRQPRTATSVSSIGITAAAQGAEIATKFDKFSNGYHIFCTAMFLNPPTRLWFRVHIRLHTQSRHILTRQRINLRQYILVLVMI